MINMEDIRKEIEENKKNIRRNMIHIWLLGIALIICMGVTYYVNIRLISHLYSITK